MTYYNGVLKVYISNKSHSLCLQAKTFIIKIENVLYFSEWNNYFSGLHSSISAKLDKKKSYFGGGGNC